MYSEDPRNRKAPSLLLGFIAITGALILALFLTGILKANAEDLIDPPHDPMFNNIVFITMTNDYMYVGGDTVIEMYEGASDGQYAQVWKSNFVQAINNFFSYVSKEQCFIVVASDGASANYMTSIREVLNSVSANYWSGSQDGNFEANDFSGYEDLYAPAGMYNVRYKSRIVKYLPVSPTPTPTSSPSQEEYFFVSLPGYGYVCLTFTCSNFNAPIQQTLQNNNMLSGIMTEFNTGDIFENGPIFIAGSKYSRSSLYFSGSNVVLGNWYSLGSSIPNTSLEYIKNNYTANSGNTIQLYSLTLSSSSSPVNDLNCIYFEYMYSGNYVTTFVEGGSFNVINVTPQLSSRSNNTFIVSSFDNTYPMYYVYKYGLNSEDNVNPNPTPSPTAAPPTPTEAPHVIINWPSGTPTPTPPFSVPGNSGTGSGSSGSGSLSPGQIDSTLDTFKTYTENNNAFAFLYACTSVIPDEALYFLFILLFILLLLACIRLFVHFTG